MSYALNGSGLIYLSQHQLERAIDIFNRCIKIHKELGDTYGVGKNYFNRSIGESDLGQFEKAHHSIEGQIQITIRSNPDAGTEIILGFEKINASNQILN